MSPALAPASPTSAVVVSAQARSESPVPPTPSSSASAPRQWYHNPQLQEPVGLPGLISTESSHDKGGDNNATLVEVSLGENQIFVMSGTWAKYPNPGVGTVGLVTNCYMVVARGPMVWRRNPDPDEFAPIYLPPKSMAGWHVANVDPAAETRVWANEWVASMVRGNATCAKDERPDEHIYPGVDLWVYE
ncbi:MAG: hypothetical protein ABSE70_05765 [Candidatus Limnocylindrales bacterium]